MPAPPAIRPTNHPFPFLLYMEWTLLGMAIASELAPSFLPQNAGLSGAAIVSILIFGMLGLWLPTRPLAVRVLHVVAQLSLVLLATRIGGAGLRLLPLLYIVLVIRSCLLFGTWGRLTITSFSFILFIGVVQARVRSFDGEIPYRLNAHLLPQVAIVRLNLILIYAILLVFLLLLMNALLSERQRQEELQRVNQKLQESAARIERLAMAQERSRIAREIHDSLGHSLTGLNIQLEGALKLWEKKPDQARQFLAQAKEMGSMALQEARQAVAALRESPFQRKELEAEIAALTEQFQDLTGVTPDVRIQLPTLSPSLQLTVYRILQEALTNICKYAQASAVTITIHPLTVPPACLHISVQDNGVGFDPQDNTTGFGLRGIQERAAAEGGQFRLTSALGDGCRIEVWLPLARELS